VAAAAPLSWTGFYIGVNGGYGWSASDSQLGIEGFSDSSCGGTCGAFRKGFNADGGFGGGQIGYNSQRGAFVFGIEADIQGSGIGGASALGFSESEDNFSASAKSDLRWFGTVRGRIGYAFDRTMLYATGGFAFGGVKDRLTAAFDESGTGDSSTVKFNDTLTGYVLGGGLEHKFAPNWSLKAEYQYLNLGDTKRATFVTFDDGEDHTDATGRFDHSYHTVRLGLNYSFGAREPLRAEPLK
jgi:outer membrane immunogenic protein